ncbi:RNA polymerase sigma factor [Parabacteroides bouchesdurhonensis]|uniref:RNA polymerase sigma factor n=1 Tax=Parabacteroides bouchesdurhonensis TaxID=1936995 RepID=UPI000C8157DE|nr:RNA polymerase sigma-70 factor [Parabacteroides bouchesdurhonensis]
MNKIKHSKIDSYLLDRIADNDEDAFSCLFSEYYVDFVVFAGTFVGGKEDSEEIVQEVFIELWESRSKLRRGGSLRSYMLTVIHNKCMDLLRHRQVKQNYIEVVAKEDLGNPYDVEASVLLADLQQKLEDAFSKIPPELLQPFKMNRFEGKKYQEIAKELDLPLRTVEFRVAKALKLIKTLLKDYFIICLFVNMM